MKVHPLVFVALVFSLVGYLLGAAANGRIDELQKQVQTQAAEIQGIKTTAGIK